jgi:ABC-type multidrug transport system fused ATPase/permease subunit
MSSAYDDALHTDDALAERLAGDLWRQLWGYTRPYRAWVWGLCACAVVVALMDVAFPLITREVVDAIAENGAAANLTPWLWAYGGATARPRRGRGGLYLPWGPAAHPHQP